MTLKLASFIVDITPPIGFPLAYGVNRKVDSPIYIRGIILNDGAKSVIFASFDVIGIAGDVYLYFRKLIAKSASVSNTHVFIHSVHQHDSIQLGNENNNDEKVKSFQKSISSRLRRQHNVRKVRNQSSRKEFESAWGTPGQGNSLQP